MNKTLNFQICLFFDSPDLIKRKLKLDNTSKSLKEANETLNENSKQIIRLETELKESKKA